ncbi:MAG: ribonuclease J [Deltaproteobacteria bacterium HGW-Deltaproteobacteria-21]|nr:MAG: ribonuclease J [Deltaproteobacteria bacterium HGW-Deltaproteobacteria-21]
MLKVIPLGGLGEIGLNMMFLEYDGRAIIVDAGLMFPEEYMPGVDVVIPDFQFLRDNKDKLQCIVLTHGHEDHIGALPFLLREFDLPVFGTSFTIELLKEKLREHNLLQSTTLHKVAAGETHDFGPFRIEFIAVNHSIVDGVGLAIETPEGTLVHSGDFKIDQTPVDGRVTDLVRFAHYGNKGVLALFSDSTNVEKDGFTLSEREVKRTLEVLFRLSKGRLIVAAFASHITRIQQIIDLAAYFHRKILFSGKSMKTNVRIAREEGLIRIPQDMEITEGMIDRFRDHELVMVTTGSQGEPMSALTRMAQDRHKGVKIRKGDTVILSSRFIPGNERAISAIINNLYRMGAEVVYEKVSDIHSSGHGYRDELKLMLNLVRPKYFIPIHGEYRHLVRHCQLAAETGIQPDRLTVVEDGMTVCFNGGEMTIGDRVHAGRVLVDGKGVGDVGEVVLRDRLRLSGEGMVIVLLAVNEQTGEVLYGPDLVSRGFVFQDQQGLYILEDAKCIVLEVLDELERPARIDLSVIGPEIKKRLKHFFYEIIERRPLVLPIILPL